MARPSKRPWPSPPNPFNSTYLNEHEQFDVAGGPDAEFIRHASTLLAYQEGKLNYRYLLQEALEYFGFEYSIQGKNNNGAGASIVIIKSQNDTVAEWSEIDRENLQREIGKAANLLRTLVTEIKKINSDEIMSDLEKLQLTDILISTERSLKDAPYIDKSRLKTLTSWLSKLAVKSTEIYAGKELGVLFEAAENAIGNLVNLLGKGISKFPWS